MSKAARALLKKINDKKNAIRGLQGQGKTQEMKDQMAELREMQEEFDMLMEMEEDDDDGIKDSLHNGKVKEIEDGQKSKKYSKAQVCKAFVNRIVCGLRKRAMPEEDQEIMDSFKNMMKEGADEDGGFTVPEDVSTDIIELRRTENDLEQYVNVEKVATMSGSRVIEVDADSTPWGDVDEGGEFGEEETPNLKQIKYAIKKKGGILKTTRELLQDTATNILACNGRRTKRNNSSRRNVCGSTCTDADGIGESDHVQRKCITRTWNAVSRTCKSRRIFRSIHESTGIDYITSGDCSGSDCSNYSSHYSFMEYE